MRYHELTEHRSEPWQRRWRPAVTLPVGHKLYHGTNSTFEPADDDLIAPAWFSSSQSVAKHFARGGQIMVYEVVEPIRLPKITSRAEKADFFERFDIEGFSSEDTKDEMQQSGLPGWIIPNNYPDGDDILLVDLSKLRRIRLSTTMEARAKQRPAEPDYHYLLNCTNLKKGEVRYLQDMIDRGKRVSYREFVTAVGLESVAAEFPEYDWSARPTEMTMRRDRLVAYYRSVFRHYPCYFVVHSGIEYVFISNNYDDKIASKRERLANAESFMIGNDGEFRSDHNGPLWGRRGRDWLSVHVSAAPSSAAATTMLSMLSPEMKLEVDDEPESVTDFQDYLRQFLTPAPLGEARRRMTPAQFPLPMLPSCR